MENKQLLLKTFLLNMASYYKVGFSWLAKSTPSVDKNVTLVKWCKSLETYCPGIVRSTYLFSILFVTNLLLVSVVCTSHNRKPSSNLVTFDSRFPWKEILDIASNEEATAKYNHSFYVIITHEDQSLLYI